MVEYLNESYEIVDKPLRFHLLGLSQTKSGYGHKLTSNKCVKLPNGKVRRIYITIFSNVGSSWIILNKIKLFLR